MWSWGVPGGSAVKNSPAMQETWFLGQEDPLEGMATHSSILAWRILWTDVPGGLQSMGSQRVRHDWATQQYLITPAEITYTYVRSQARPWVLVEGSVVLITWVFSRVSAHGHCSFWKMPLVPTTEDMPPPGSVVWPWYWYFLLVLSSLSKLSWWICSIL